jgi:hypothetical protein
MKKFMKIVLVGFIIGIGVSLLMVPLSRLIFDTAFARGHFCGGMSSIAFMTYLRFKN